MASKTVTRSMFLHWRANLADQNKQQPLKINIHVTYHTVLSLIDTCQHCSTNRPNQALRSLANAGFQNRGVCLQAFPSYPSPSPHFHFLALVSFLARPKPRILFLGLSLLRNLRETLATQTTCDVVERLGHFDGILSSLACILTKQHGFRSGKYLLKTQWKWHF